MAPKKPGKKVSKKKTPTARKETTPSSKTTPSTPSHLYPLIQSRINNFKLSVVKQREGWAIDTSDNFKALKNYGVVYGHEDVPNKEWVCLVASACAEACENGWTMKMHFEEDKNRCVILKKKRYIYIYKKEHRYITSNVNRHLKDQHGILTDASKKQASKSLNENQYRHELLQSFKNNMSRLGELQWVLMIILCRLPTAFGSYKVVKDTMALTGMDELKRNLYRSRVNHIITEIYNQTLAVARQQILEAKKAHGNRIFSINVDNWKSKNSTRKFMGVRLYFNDVKMKFQSWMLSIREFNPSSQMRQGSTGLQRAMNVWAKAILLHYGIKYEEIFSATTDKAGDVRILNQLDIDTNWDWCIPHMLNCALYYAFSAARNPWMSNEITAMKNAINSIRDLTKDGNIFQEILAAENPEAKKKLLQTHQEQRFMGVYLTCLRYYEMFETISETCLAAGIVNQVKMTKVELKQLISVLQPLRNISVKSQTQQSAYGFRILQKLIHERLKGVLNASKCVRAFDDKEEIIESLCTGVTRTRKLLIDAIDLKFFKRYFQKTKVTKSGEVTVQAYLLECQHLLHPALRNLDPVLSVIEHMVKNDSSACIAWTTKNKKAGVKYAKSLIARNMSNRSIDVISNEYFERKVNEYILHVQCDIVDTVKNHIIDTIVENDPSDDAVSDDDFAGVEELQRDLQFASLEDWVTEQHGQQQPQSSTGGRRPQSVVRRVSQCLDQYLKAKSGIHPAFRNHSLNCNMVEWKSECGHQFLDVVRAFAAYFGVPTSSAGIELDFYFASLLLVKQRMSMKGPLVEMMNMVDRNQEWVDLAQVDALTPLEAKKAQPNFDGDDHVVYSDDEEDMGHAENENESEVVDDDDDGNYDIDLEEQRRVKVEKKRSVERKRKQEEYLANEKIASEENIRYETELKKCLVEKQKLADQRQKERESHDRRAKKKKDAEEAKENEMQLKKEMQQHNLRKIELDQKLKMQQEAFRKTAAAEKRLEEDDRALQKASIERERVESAIQHEHSEAEKKKTERLQRDAMHEDARVKSALQEKEEKAAATEAKDRADQEAMKSDAELQMQLRDQWEKDEQGEINNKREDEAEAQRVADMDTAEAKIAEPGKHAEYDENPEGVEKNEKSNEKSMLPRPRMRNTVKESNFVDDAKKSRREILEEKRNLLKAKIAAAGRRIDLINPLVREQESIEEELFEQESSYAEEDIAPHVVPSTYIYGVGSESDASSWDDEKEYIKL